MMDWTNLEALRMSKKLCYLGGNKITVVGVQKLMKYSFPQLK